jgi:myo-inositol-1(or 4)-monophosphatase
MATRSPVLNMMIRAADKAAKSLKRDFGEVENLQVSKKGPADFVSAADRKAEKTLRQELSKARPEFGLLMEESGEQESRDEQRRRFIVDPLDGTSNFLHGLPHFAISIALEQRGEIVSAVVYDPIKEEMFWAEKGVGAYLNDRRIRVSARDRLDQALIGTGAPFKGHGDRGQFQAELDAVMANTAGVRRMGSAALDLAYVAAGRFEGYWERALSPWDIAGGICLVREAGGFVGEIEGKAIRIDSPSILAANAELEVTFQRLLQKAGKTAKAPAQGGRADGSAA